MGISQPRFIVSKQTSQTLNNSFLEASSAVVAEWFGESDKVVPTATAAVDRLGGAIR